MNVQNLHISIVYKDDSIIVANKPAGLPSAPLAQNDTYNAFSQCALLYPAVRGIQGKKTLEGGLVHRLDTDTQGLLLIAVNQAAYDNLIFQQEQDDFIKYYTAFCLSIKKNTSPLNISSRFRPYGKGRKQVKPVFSDDTVYAQKKAGKQLYTTKIISIDPLKVKDRNLLGQSHFMPVRVDCKISRGYRHQVRVHLAAAGLPVIGDALYNPFETFRKKTGGNAENQRQGLQFFASGLEFSHPVSRQKIQFTADKAVFLLRRQGKKSLLLKELFFDWQPPL